MTGSGVTPVSAEPPALGRRVLMRQRWDELCFLHWSYPPDVVQGLLPDGIRVDTFDRRAWVGLIPFEMRNISFPPMPSVPWLGSFVEVNVRTYVIDGSGRRAVWFASLDIDRLVPVAVARAAFRLPYCWARTRHTASVGGSPGDARRSVVGTRHRYEVRRRWPTDAATGVIECDVGNEVPPAEQSDFDVWSSARWGLVAGGRTGTRHGRVSHPRWPLHRADLVAVDTGLITAAGLPAPDGDPVVAYSPGVAVELAWLEAATTSEAAGDLLASDR